MPLFPQELKLGFKQIFFVILSLKKERAEDRVVPEGVDVPLLQTGLCLGRP